MMRAVLTSISEDTDGRSRPQNRLEFVEEAAGMGSLEDLQAMVEANPADLEARYGLAVAQVVAEEYEGALLNCLRYFARRP